MHTQQPVADNNSTASHAPYPFHRLKLPAEHPQPIKVLTRKPNGRQQNPPDEKTNRKKPTLLCTDGHKTLAGGIAHNFNNLLMGMNGYIELMLLNPEVPHNTELNKIKKRIFYGSAQIKEFLAYARKSVLNSSRRPRTGAIKRESYSCRYETIKKGKRLAETQCRPNSLNLEMAADMVVEELMQVLSAIQCITTTILNDLPPDHRHCEYLEKIEKLVGKGTEMANQLGQCSRKAGLSTKPVRMDCLVRDAMDTFCGIREKVNVHQRFSENLREVMVDPCQIEQIIQNMYLNAADAMPCGGDFIIEATNVGIQSSKQGRTGCGGNRYILLKLSDTGTGMDPETAGQIFEPFFSTKGLKGRGLGLSSVHGIVRAHGGRIDVDSRPGQGTTFKIFLPAISRAEEEEVLLAAS